MALANGFKLKIQPDGSEDLNPYVYQFAEKLIFEAKKDVAIKMLKIIDEAKK